MKQITSSAQSFQALCPKCAKYTLYSVFHSSFYDFETYFGLKTKSLYRVNLENAKYGIVKKEEALVQISQAEGGRDNLLRHPSEIECNHCFNKFAPNQPLTEGFEEKVLAYAI